MDAVMINWLYRRYRCICCTTLYLFVGMLLMPAPVVAQAQDEVHAAITPTSPHWAIKTNLIGWATASPNLSAESLLGRHTTLNLGVSYNPFTFKDNKKWKHLLVQPELRYWLCAPFGGHYIGGHLIYAHYNSGGIHMPFGIWKEWKGHRYQGDMYAIGLTYGYQWILSPHWGIEAAAGIGYGYTHYRQYACRTCGKYLGTQDKHLLMPTKLAISVVYIIK